LSHFPLKKQAAASGKAMEKLNFHQTYIAYLVKGCLKCHLAYFFTPKKFIHTTMAIKNQLLDACHIIRRA